MKTEIHIHIEKLIDNITIGDTTNKDYSDLPERIHEEVLKTLNKQELEKTVMECLTRVVHNGSKVVDEQKVVTDIGNASVTPKENQESIRPIANLYIGKLIEKVSIELRPSTEKTYEDLSRLLHEEGHRLGVIVSQEIVTALCNLQETFGKALEVDDSQKK
jgi:adenosine deaminase